MAQTVPTKGNLMTAKRSRELAATGYELMDRKRNILIRELMTRIEEARELQSHIDETFNAAYAAMRIAEVSMGGSAEAAAEGVPLDDSVQLRYKSVMGVEIPSVTADDFIPDGPPYGLAFTNTYMDNAFFKFAEVKSLVIKLAETENTIYRLASAIKTAQKRANALQNIVIPGLEEDISRIADALAEKEREEFVRLKVVKNRRSQHL